ncbi:type II toxin-antitoxin system RelE/ParE family toxin [Azospirillum rugosum]|uniref:Phage-related protein n=1 Tax=Azospirillum rugosum TaxID=416170 RepID=A0ABS4SPN6_9PROT|nr:type II toxin-antitoxin system RelE/ParE family toxin [Azospirillum rugosum]MBP2294512.1 phage-related protein [Azospirillum rugosum]MDQ0529017.1 phage-related protein [Azospirillum rugosum]
MAPKEKAVLWVSSARDDLVDFPIPVKRTIGFAVHLAQIGLKHEQAKPLQGFGGASVLEVVEDHRGDTYRAVYTVRFEDAVIVLHAFQKKSKRGIATPAHEIDLIRKRLKLAEELYAQWKTGKRKPS